MGSVFWQLCVSHCLQSAIKRDGLEAIWWARFSKSFMAKPSNTKDLESGENIPLVHFGHEFFYFKTSSKGEEEEKRKKEPPRHNWAWQIMQNNTGLYAAPHHTNYVSNLLRKIYICQPWFTFILASRSQKHFWWAGCGYNALQSLKIAKSITHLALNTIPKLMIESISSTGNY